MRVIQIPGSTPTADLLRERIQQSVHFIRALADEHAKALAAAQGPRAHDDDDELCDDIELSYPQGAAMGDAYDDSFSSAREVLQDALDDPDMDPIGKCASSLRASIQLLSKRPRLATELRRLLSPTSRSRTSPDPTPPPPSSSS